MADEVKIGIKEFYDALDSIGTEEARKMAKDVIKESNLPVKDSYSIDEAIKICTTMKKKEGFVRVAGCLLVARFAFRRK